MANAPSVDAALRNAAAEVAGVAPNPADMRLATYGESSPNLAQTVGYDDYMRHIGLPIAPASGTHYSPAGMREGYENYGFPPVVYQRSPYATAAYRSFVDPWGQMMVQPLVGFPSAYPHVLSGVPTDFQNSVGYAMSLLGPMHMWTPQMAARPASPAVRARSDAPAKPVVTKKQPNMPVIPSLKTRQPRQGYADPMQADTNFNDVASRYAVPSATSADPITRATRLQPTAPPVGMYPNGVAPQDQPTIIDGILGLWNRMQENSVVKNPYGM